MAKKSAVKKVSRFVLEFGFSLSPEPEKKWLDIPGLYKVLHERGKTLRAAWGSLKYDMLLQFCKKCLNDGNEDMIITVVAKGGEMGMVSYQCLFECNGTEETFILNASFFEDFGSPNETIKTRKNTPMYQLALA